MRTLIAGMALLALPAAAVETRTALNVAEASQTAVVTSSAVVNGFTSVNSPATTFRFNCTTDTLIEFAATDVSTTGYVTRTTLLSAYTPEYFEVLERQETRLRALSASGTCYQAKMGKGM